MVFVDDFVTWEKKLALRRTAVLFVTLWMTYRAFDWATEYAAATLAIDMQGREYYSGSNFSHNLLTKGSP